MNGEAGVVCEKTDVLRDQVRRVHEARCGSAILQERLEAERQTFEQSIAALAKIAKDAIATLQAEEQTLRELVSARYKATGEKQPTPGVEVRIVKTLEYDQAAAFAWAKSTGMALTLDRKAFEQIALASPVAGATVKELPRVRIAQDLTKAVTG